MKARLTIFILLAAAAYYAYQQPESIPHPGLRDQVLGLKSSQELKLPQASGSAIIQSAAGILRQVSKVRIPAKISGMPEEVIVEDIVGELTGQVKDLPNEQVKKIKVQFCQDVISDSVATVSGDGHGN